MNLQGKRAAIVTLGCKVNQYETDAMYGMLKEAGVTMVDPKEAADIYIVNTCSVTNMAERKSRQMLHRAKKKNPDVVVVAVGCYAQVGKEELSKDTNIDLIIGNNKKKDLIHILEEHMGEKESAAESIEVIDIAHDQEYESLHVEQLKEHTRAYIKVQDGCNQFCSYCIIPYARGRVRSRSMEDILQEVQALTANGYKEIVLTGIHISSYGLDFEHTSDTQEDYGPFKNSALIDLIEAISGIDGLERIRLGSLEPRIITENFVKRLSKVPQICPHFHLSLQSGCDATLKRMNRHYTTDLYLEKCELLRQYFDRPALTTDVIVGFPGETEEEFARTEEFLAKVHFSDMHIFKYSKRHGTKAADMPDQINPQIQTERSEKLITLGEKMKNDFIEACKDQEQIVLIEEEAEINGTKYMTGHSNNYIRCAFESDGLVPNMVIKGTINSKLNEEFVFCKRID